MCGRFYAPPITIEELRSVVKDIEEELARKQQTGEYGKESLIVPTLPTMAITAEGAKVMTFGWKKAQKDMMLNARCETLTGKPMFVPAFRAGKRCILPATRFFEKKGLFAPINGQLMFMAGIFDNIGSQEYDQFLVITRDADPVIAPYHHRMPLLLPSEELRKAWLHSDTLAEELLDMPVDIPLKDITQ
ncbi:MAG: SOS response-associated peptidase [Clostridiales bacterium]|jgi:putative SOS response-associated peptidase YedK|nr:SOS response-associated peptidase [Clostridiales bacterium]